MTVIGYSLAEGEGSCLTFPDLSCEHTTIWTIINTVTVEPPQLQCICIDSTTFNTELASLH